MYESLNFASIVSSDYKSYYYRERVLYQLRSLKKCIPRHMREANMRRKER